LQRVIPQFGECLVFSLVKAGEIETEWSAYLTESLDDRLAADYDVEISFSRQEARSECRRTDEFLKRIKRYLLKNGLKETELRKRQRSR
jgi:uncharacterized protein (UPF0332 family)